ncbi:MAG: molecular chaperone DnaK [Armatimonadetes bacterium]|nr:molecular chaperone DnaK [Armatimonadota bacterium]
MPKAVGIDLGTTNSCVAAVIAGDPTVIHNAEGGRVTPSIVHFSKTGEVLVGEPAKRQAILSPDRTVRSVKRLMGQRTTAITVDGRDYTPEQISARILEKLARDAATYLGEPVKQAVITVPAYFDDAQRTATKHAGEIAGLEVLRIINEPTAAALAYGHKQQKMEGTILVYDLGGGTFDVTIMDVEIDKAKTEERDYYEVRSTAGDTHLGGDDIDQALIDFLADQFQKEHGVDLRQDRQALQRLKEAAEKAKIELSSALQTNINLPFLYVPEGGSPLHLEMTLTRAQLEELARPIVERTRPIVLRAMEDAKVGPGDISEVILVGGQTRMPMVQQLVRELTGKEPRRDINPDEVVAVGAAIQAAVLTQEMKDMVLLDVTPLSLGVETLGDVMDVLIPRNTTIPTRVSRIYTTASDYQPSVEIHVLQGERPRASQNRSLGRFQLTGIPPAPRGMPRIEVTFDIDANGILNVTAEDKGTGKKQDITITGSSSLSPDEVQRMVQEAEAHRQEDERFRRLAQARNEADALAYQLEKTINDLRDKLSESERQSLEAKVKELREASQGDDEQAIRRKIDEVNQAFSEVSRRLYEAASAGVGSQAAEGTTGQPGPGYAGGRGPGPAAGPGGDVIDAEFEAEDEK